MQLPTAPSRPRLGQEPPRILALTGIPASAAARASSARAASPLPGAGSAASGSTLSRQRRMRAWPSGLQMWEPTSSSSLAVAAALVIGGRQEGW